MRAREEYFERAGKVFDDDAELFEGRMASFLEWYVLERPLRATALTPVRARSKTSAALPARRAAGRWRALAREPPQPVRAATSVGRACWTSRTCIGGARFPVHERRKHASACDRATSSRRASSGTASRSSSAGPSCSTRPTRARSCSTGSSAAVERGVARDEILFHLSRQHIRWHRQGHVGAAKIYRGETA